LFHYRGVETEIETEDKKRRAKRARPATLRWVIRNYKILLSSIGATAVAVSGIWAFFYSKMLELKNERISAQSEEIQRVSKIAAIPDTIDKLDKRIAGLENKIQFYDSAFPGNDFDGTIVLGGNIGASTRLTAFFNSIQDLISGKKYDLAEAKIKELDKFNSSYGGTLYLKWNLALQRGYQDDALSFADKVIERMPTEERIKGVYEWAIVIRLEKGDRKRAEQIGLSMVRAFPNDKEAFKKFENAFKYTPSIKPNSP
jgi:tetratricopeptide (TPR) repeat protein